MPPGHSLPAQAPPHSLGSRSRRCDTGVVMWSERPTSGRSPALPGQGHRISADTVGDLLREEGFSLQSNAKTLEGKQHPDRDEQFHYLNDRARDYQDSKAPVISVDTKKKELVGPFNRAVFC